MIQYKIRNFKKKNEEEVKKFQAQEPGAIQQIYLKFFPLRK